MLSPLMPQPVVKRKGRLRPGPNFAVFIDLLLHGCAIIWPNTYFMESGRPWNKQISAPDASQPSSQERWQVADLKHLKISYIFSLPRISTKDFPYIKGKIDRSIGINYSYVNFKWTQVFLCYQSFDTLGARDLSCAVSGFGQVSQRTMNFLKNAGHTR